MTLNGAQFDMTPGWRKPPRPGVEQQGKLFHGGEKPPDEHRYPRGYNPERLHEVAANVVDVGVAAKSEHPFVAGNVRPETAQYPWNAKKAARSQIVDTLARSTIDSSAPKDVSFYVGATGQGGVSVDGLHQRNVGPGGGVSLYGPSDRFEAERTLLHEMGHSASHRQGRESSQYKTSDQKGREEAYADTFAVAHERRRPGDKRTAKDPDYWFSDPMAKAAYRREVPRLRPEFGLPTASSTPALASDPNAQPHLFGRNADKSRTDVEPDYGQFGYSDYTKGREQPLGTLPVGLPKKKGDA